MQIPLAFAFVLVGYCFTTGSIAQTPLGSPGAKSLKEQCDVIPFVRELNSVKFKRTDRQVPDELRVVITANLIQINGTKKTSTKPVRGRDAGHIGKLCLIRSLSPSTGTMLAKIPTLDDATTYGVCLDTGEFLTSKNVHLDHNAAYEWKTKTDGESFFLEVTKGGRTVESLRADTATVKGFGFFSTVRSPGDKSDVLITVTPSAK